MAAALGNKPQKPVNHDSNCLPPPYSLKTRLMRLFMNKLGGKYLNFSEWGKRRTCTEL